ncbi:MAG: N-acetylglucosamine-6-phosphate deacetylase [Saprospiraceae bacterium]|nr:N-acetylglucosamine-6-phosphate deacetylase [Saprospiraceae bacterium]
MTAYTNGHIFTGSEILDNHTVLTQNGRIVGVVKTEETPTEAERIDLQGHLLASAFIDIQIYGGNGHLFGEFPSVEALKATYDYCLAGGAAHFLPTVATNSETVMLAAIEAVRDYWAQGGKGVLGLHLEGPYLNAAKRGAHIEKLIKHHPSVSDIEKWLDKGKGIVKIMTLAPEVCSDAIVRLLQDNGIILSVGHTNASFEQATTAFDTIGLATHLFNAMSPFGHRAMGVVGAVFAHPSVKASLVADGHHVDFEAIKIAKKLMGERLFLITDAVTENTEGGYSHRLEGDKYVIADGTLSGSALTMAKAVQNCVEKVGISLEESLRMASLYPAQAVGWDKELGRVAVGYRADFVVLDKDFTVKNTFCHEF